MPIHYNDGLDDQLAYDITGSFIGGMVSSVRSNLLKDTQYAESKNMDINKFGSIITRRGTEIIGATLTDPVQGLFFYDKSGTTKLLAAADGVMYTSTGGAWSSLAGYTPNSSADVEFSQLVDKVYMTDNVGNVHSYDGTTVTDEAHTSTDPPRGKYLITHTNRLFMGNTENYDDELAASDLLDGGTWGAAFKIRIGGGEGDPITGIVSWYNHNMLVFKNRSIHMISTNPAESTAGNWAVNKVDDSIGCVSHRTIAQAGSDVFFLSRQGVRSIKTILSGAQSSTSEPISSSIDDYMDRINWTAAATSTAIFWNNRYILSVPLDSATTPNYTFVLNTVTQSFSGYWTGWTPRCYEISSFSQLPKLVFAQEDGKVLTWLDYVAEDSAVAATYQDDGADYESMLFSRGHVYGDHMSPKLGNHVEVELSNTNEGCECVEILVTADDGAVTTDKQLGNMIDTLSTPVELPVDVPFDLPRVGNFSKSFNLTNMGEFSEIQFKIQSSTGKLLVRSIKTSAYMNTMTLEK